MSECIARYRWIMDNVESRHFDDGWEFYIKFPNVQEAVGGDDEERFTRLIDAMRKAGLGNPPNA